MTQLKLKVKEEFRKQGYPEEDLDQLAEEELGWEDADALFPEERVSREELEELRMGVD